MNEPEAREAGQSQGTGESDNHAEPPPAVPAAPERPSEVSGPSGPEPTRYGDWERRGRCIDF